ncbi:MAG: YdeI/OmpD-associated family protein [Bryobacteraceae bacterium]|nr:YdeI/OmpD-associated family protein [Bryobacteraceae bacterium]
MAPAKTPLPEMPFRSQKTFETWLRRNHQKCPGIWLRFAKKDSGIPTVAPTDAVDTAICYGWIDGQIQPRDGETYLVRYGPRAKRSIWSKINRERVARLTAAGRMQPAGLAEVERAQADGRWAAAYDSARTSTVPPDLAAALAARPGFTQAFAALKAQERYSILFRLQTSKKPETRARLLERFLIKLAE